jgi:hypothetical protein
VRPRGLHLRRVQQPPAAERPRRRQQRAAGVVDLGEALVGQRDHPRRPRLAAGKAAERGGPGREVLVDAPVDGPAELRVDEHARRGQHERDDPGERDRQPHAQRPRPDERDPHRPIMTDRGVASPGRRADRVGGALGSGVGARRGLCAAAGRCHRGPMRIAVPAAPALCATAALAACGHAALSMAPPRASAPTGTACPAIARAELTTVARRIYRQAVDGRNEAAATRRIAHAPALASAVAAHDPAATRRALAPLLKHQITRIVVTDGHRALASAGRAPAYAPARGPIVAGGRVVGRYVLSVGEQAAYTGLTRTLTGASARFARAAAPGAAAFPATVFPRGRRVVSLRLPAVPRSVCAPTVADTRLAVMGLVARHVLAAEQHSASVRRALRHAEADPAFRAAVAAGDPAATRAAIIGFFRDDRFHIVRVRAWNAHGLITDVGGPYVLGPATGTVRSASGAIAGHVMLAVQDDTGYIKLVHRFTGAGVVLRTAAGTVPGSTAAPGPPFSPGLGTATDHGRGLRTYGLRGTAFPSGPLDVTLLAR